MTANTKTKTSGLEGVLLTLAKEVLGQMEFDEATDVPDAHIAEASKFSRCGFRVTLGTNTEYLGRKGVLVRIEYPGCVEFARDFYPRFTGHGQDWKAPAAINIFFKKMDIIAKRHDAVTMLKGVYPAYNSSKFASPELIVEYIVSPRK